MASFESTIHIDQALTNVSILYKNDALIADRIFPSVQVDKASNEYFIYNKSDAFDDVSPLTNHNSAVQEITYGVSTGTYQTEEFALAEFVSDKTIRNADAPLSPLMDSSENIARRLRLSRERRLADQLFSTSTFTGSHLTDLSAGTKWSNVASEPINQILAAKDSLIGVDGPYCILFGNDAWTAFRTHPDVLAAIQFATGGVAVSEEQVKGFFGFEDVIVGTASRNTANPGQTASYSRIWTDSVLVFKRAATLQVKEVSLGYCFEFGQMETVRWVDQSRGAKGGEWVKTGWAYQDKIVASDAGHLIYDVL